MNKSARIGARLLCAVLTLSVLLSSAFILHEAGHDCIGEDCPVCRHIAISRDMLRLIGAAILPWALRAMAPDASVGRYETLGQFIPAPGTLVSRKIRLNS